MTREDVAHQIIATLGPHLGSFPVADMVEEFIERYGCVSVGDVPENEYWDLVEKHDTF